MKSESKAGNGSTSTSFKLVNSISKDDDPQCTIPVSKYVSNKTGMVFYLCPIDGPVVEGYFSLATEALDDDGLPHTLEHMIFLGSEDYPYAGVLDLLANKVFASGTNAWTDVDNTTYTLSTIEKTGFLQLLPIFLDHILFPLLNESGFTTEVYHINGDGEDSGVVYSEMQSIENEDETIVERAIHKAIYPNEDCGYRYETGGALKNLRTSTSYQKVCDYHKKMYKPDNLAIIVAGKIDANEVIEVLEKFEQKILSKAKNPESWRLAERPFTRPILPLTENIEQTVFFPSDQGESANGIVAIAWRGPNINELKELVALDLLFSYLSESSISPLHEHFIDKQGYCSKLSYQIEEYRETYLCVNFTNTQVQNLDKIKPELFKIFDDIVQKKSPFNIDRLKNLIKMKISELKDKYEDEPHDTISKVCIGDFLYGKPDDKMLFKTRFAQTSIFESLLKDTDESYWINLLKRYMVDTNWVEVKAKPCEKLMHAIGEEDKQRVEDRKKQLGKKGLKELKAKVDNAVDQNDDYEVPDVVYKKIKVPSLENVKLRNLQQFFTYEFKKGENFPAIQKGFNGFANLQHLQMQVDHLEGTQFVQAVMLIDTSTLSQEHRRLLPLFVNLFFELPIATKDLKLSHEEVVFELNRDLLEFEATIGINGSDLSLGSFPQYLMVFTKVALKDYELAVRWLKLVIFNSVFDIKQIQVTISNLLKDIKNKKQQPSDLLGAVCRDLNYEPESNICLSLFTRQEAFLKEIGDSLAQPDSAAYGEALLQKLEDVRSSLLKDKQVRFYLCADLDQLHKTQQRPLDQVWLEHFPSTQSDSTSVFKSNQPFEVYNTWKMRKNYVKKRLSQSPGGGDLPKVWTEMPKRDYAISLGSTESAYLRLSSSVDVHSYADSNYAALLVLIEYFTQTEGPLYEAVRGPGYAYHQSIYLNAESAQLDLFLDECSNPVKAYEAVRTVFSEHSTTRNNFDAQLLESAKNSLIFLLIDDLKSVSNYSAYSMSNLFKGISINEIRDLIKRIENVEIKELRKLLKTYMMPLFNDEHSNCLIVCHPAKSESIISDFSNMFDRKLNAIGKIDECLCSIAAD